MKINSKTDYAIRTVVDLALHKKSGVSNVSDIAKRQSISRDYLQQILLSLKAAGIVNSKRGLDGGYMLSQDPTDISLSSIVSLTNPSLLRNNPDKETTSEERIVTTIWNQLTSELNNELNNISVQDLCDQLAAMKDKDAGNYII